LERPNKDAREAAWGATRREARACFPDRRKLGRVLASRGVYKIGDKGETRIMFGAAVVRERGRSEKKVNGRLSGLLRQFFEG